MTFITSGPVLAFVLAGDNAIVSVRALNGATNPVDAAPGSIRGDYALTMDANVVHASDSPEAAAREVSLWFPEYKIISRLRSFSFYFYIHVYL